MNRKKYRASERTSGTTTIQTAAEKEPVGSIQHKKFIDSIVSNPVPPYNSSAREDIYDDLSRDMQITCYGAGGGGGGGVVHLPQASGPTAVINHNMNKRTRAKFPEDRKACPVASGVLDYFPDALVAVAEVSAAGNDQHHKGKPLHWDRNKSSDEADACIRHFMQRGLLDTDGKRHSAKMAWRALALLQKEIEAEQQNLGLPKPKPTPNFIS